MKLPALMASLLVVAACGSSGQLHATASNASGSRTQASPSATSSQGALFAVVSNLPGAQQVNSTQSASATIRIVDVQGQVHASATFQPPPAPQVGNAAALLQSPVRTVKGAAYYADSTGAVHRLAPDGTTSVVATFPLTNPQQELTYAVSPDGTHLIAIVLSTPQLHNPPPQTLQDPLFVAGSPWTLTLETADAGGKTTVTLQRNLGTTYPKPTLIVGWDAKGPLATLNSGLGTQAETFSAHLFGADGGGAPLIHVASDGTHLDQIGGAGCLAVDEIADGTVICGSFDAPQYTVRSSDGTLLWAAGVAPDIDYAGPWLSPGGDAIAFHDAVVTPESLASAARQNSYQPSINALGWLDDSTVVESTLAGGLALYDAHGLTKIRDLGVSGIFEGLL
jgi:hypothetical protein